MQRESENGRTLTLRAHIVAAYGRIVSVALREHLATGTFVVAFAYEENDQ